MRGLSSDPGTVDTKGQFIWWVRTQACHAWFTICARVHLKKWSRAWFLCTHGANEMWKKTLPRQTGTLPETTVPKTRKTVVFNQPSSLTKTWLYAVDVETGGCCRHLCLVLMLGLNWTAVNIKKRHNWFLLPVYWQFANQHWTVYIWKHARAQNAIINMKADQMAIGERGTIVDGHGIKQSCLMWNYLISPKSKNNIQRKSKLGKIRKKKLIAVLAKTLQLPQKDQTLIYIYFN